VKRTTKRITRRAPRINSLKVGDRVRILHYKTTIAWGDRKPQEYGFVMNIDGAYVLVRPRWRPRRELIEFLLPEIVSAPYKRR